MKTLSRDAVQRMVGGGAGSGGAGGAGGEEGLSAAWVGNNYVGKDYFNQIFEVRGTKTTTVGSGTPTVESHIFSPNEVPSIQSSTEGGVTTTIVTVITDIKVKGGVWTESYVSALGQNSSGGGGGGSSTLAGLNDVQLGTLATNDVLTYDGSGHWVNTPKTTLLLGYATQLWVIGQNYLTASAISDMATQTWVNTQISDMATQTWVGQQGFLTSSALTGYATQQWVGQQGYITGITSAMVTGALGFTPMSNGTTFWGQSVSGGAVSGSIEAGNSGGYIAGFDHIELNTHGSSSQGYGGYVDFHYNGSSADYTSRIIEDASGRLAMNGFFKVTNNSVIIGGIEITVANNGLHINSAGLYADTYVSALGLNSSAGGGVENLTITDTLSFVTNGSTSAIYNDQYGQLHIDGSENIIMGNDLHTDGYTLFTDNGDIDAGTGYVKGTRFYVGTNRYIYLDGTTLKYYDNGTTKTIQLV